MEEEQPKMTDATIGNHRQCHGLSTTEQAIYPRFALPLKYFFFGRFPLVLSHRRKWKFYARLSITRQKLTSTHLVSAQILNGAFEDRFSS